MTSREETDIEKITPRKVGHHLMITIDEAQKLLKLAGYETDKSSLDTLIYDVCLRLVERNQTETSYFAANPFTTTMISRQGLIWLAYEYGKPNDDFAKAVDMVFGKEKRA